MAIIPNGQQFNTVSASEVLKETGSAFSNDKKHVYKMSDIVETVSSTSGKKAYIAKWSQTGSSAPTPTEIFNNTGATFTWTRTVQGTYKITASSAVFTADKTFYNIQGAGSAAASQIVQPTSINTTEATYRQIAASTGATQDGNSGWLEIRIYS
jgi:lipopolysaccharide export system protein LptC